MSEMRDIVQLELLKPNEDPRCFVVADLGHNHEGMRMVITTNEIPASQIPGVLMSDFVGQFVTNAINRLYQNIMMDYALQRAIAENNPNLLMNTEGA